MQEHKKHGKELTFASASLILGIIITVILICALWLKTRIVTTFFITALVAIVISFALGYSYKEIEKTGLDYSRKGLQPFFILIAVGGMVAMWLSAGTISTLIYYGLLFISPKFFLLTVLLLCSITSITTGTSWGSMATAGVAMMGVGESMGVPAAITAGAVISGSYFGDKMSPFSDTTNIAAAVTHTPLMTHVRHMVIEQAPSYIVTTIIFTVMGLKYANYSFDSEHTAMVMSILSEHFKIGFISLIPLFAVVGLLLFHTPALLAIVGGAAAGAFIAAVYQGVSIHELSVVFYNGFSIQSGTDLVDKILNRGGIASMFDLSILIMFAMFVSGVLTHIGAMNAFIKPVIKKVRGTGSLVFITLLLTYFLNAVAGSFTLSAVMTASFMLPLYDHYRLRSENLSRAIEASGTYGGVLIPWNGHAVYAVGTLGVPTLDYVPYCFLNYLSPVVTLIYGITGFSMTKYSEEEFEQIVVERSA